MEELDGDAGLPKLELVEAKVCDLLKKVSPHEASVILREVVLNFEPELCAAMRELHGRALVKAREHEMEARRLREAADAIRSFKPWVE